MGKATFILAKGPHLTRAWPALGSRGCWPRRPKCTQMAPIASKMNRCHPCILNQTLNRSLWFSWLAESGWELKKRNPVMWHWIEIFSRGKYNIFSWEIQKPNWKEILRLPETHFVWNASAGDRGKCQHCRKLIGPGNQIVSIFELQLLRFLNSRNFLLLGGGQIWKWLNL